MLELTASIRGSAESTALAISNLERRAMEYGLTGEEAGRLLVNILDEWGPYGAEDTWHWETGRRKILKVQATWSRSCMRQGLRASCRAWDLIVEGAYRRAVAELEPSRLSQWSEQISLQSKIDFWRQKIPEASGAPGHRNLLEEQRELQLYAVDANGEPQEHPEVLIGDLLPWRQADLLEYHEANLWVSPTETGGVLTHEQAVAAGWESEE